jgi:adenylate cyclase
MLSALLVKNLAQKTKKRVSGGERVARTILFSDMRGFTSMSERLTPQEVVAVLNRCLSLQADQVTKHGGDIDKYVGDCVVALFAGEDMEFNAVRCAVEIHKTIEAHNASNPAGESLKLGIGIATGEVIMGSIGSPDRLEYTAVGAHMNLCSRLCSLAGPREILLSESTYQAVRSRISAQRLEPVNVKGFNDPVPVYRIFKLPRRRSDEC